MQKKVACLFHALQLDLVNKAQLVSTTSSSVPPVMSEFDYLENYECDYDETCGIRIFVICTTENTHFITVRHIFEAHTIRLHALHEFRSMKVRVVIF